MPDFNDWTNAEVAMAHGLKPRVGRDAAPEDIGQLNPYDALDCDFVHVNQLLKYLKLGFGKASEQMSGFIRGGLMSREEAVRLAQEIDGRCAPRYIRSLCDFLRIDEGIFWEVAERYRNDELWEPDGNDWRLKYPLE